MDVFFQSMEDPMTDVVTEKVFILILSKDIG